ncbi:citrinin biosynthesis oxidoreductase CtnB [Microthyrium microscopicum]|uniref:Citrinin biosynthesis oxidoreductase CtnB n=1 Tax=Microthyrium microscopicum TaxID=703497 RepID=A0A6A6UQ36_9PEZI|nr:citrinin biosynthesis oxidoreductase CtnB [Microthyrium microscopicum]
MANVGETANKALPRILCLHGGGVNAEVFRMQARTIIKTLNGQFRFVFADGPFYCDPGPGIVPVYEEYGPFRRWLRWLPEHPEVEAEAAADEIWYQLRDAMEADDLAGGTGAWVGMIGFSQGAKLAASLLYEQQYRNLQKEAGKSTAEDDTKPTFKFAVLLAGRAPLVSLREETDGIEALVTASEVSEGFEAIETISTEHILRLPTIHVHGLQDAGLHLHQRLLQQYCDPAATTLVEWDGAHRVPLKSSDVQKVTNAIIEVARKEGIL